MSNGLQAKEKRISLGRRLRCCPFTRCLGVQPNWGDYDSESRNAIKNADSISYPGPHYGALFESLGKMVFPRNYYPFMGNKIRQTCLFQLLGIPHPKTRLYYGAGCEKSIRRDFSFPFIAKTPVGSSQGSGVWLVQDDAQLRGYLLKNHPAYIQEYLPMDRDLRVVLIHGTAVNAYWRIAAPGEFRNNVSRGARISFEGIPPEGVQFAESVARRCGFQEVGLDICVADNRYCVIEANMMYGVEGFQQKGQDIHELLARLERERVF